MDCCPVPHTPILATTIPPPLRSGQVSLDEAEHFLDNRDQRRYAPMVFGLIPECRSDSLRNELHFRRNPHVALPLHQRTTTSAIVLPSQLVPYFGILNLADTRIWNDSARYVRL